MTVQKWSVLGGFGYHGNFLVFFWFLVCRVSNFVRRYSISGLEPPVTSPLKKKVNFQPLSQCCAALDHVPMDFNLTC